MFRFFDLLFSTLGIIILSPLFFLLIVISYSDTGHPIFLQERLGKNKKTFRIIKFRTLKFKSSSISYQVSKINSISSYGSFMRKSKLDELPQLWNVLNGQMSLVGPRPNLLNQEEVIAERDSKGIYAVRPGITGLAQINKIDMSTPQLLAFTDAKMIQELNTITYFRYIFLTVIGKGFGDRIKL
jgi:O-antigen biosynthesis protein WbqP